MADLDNYHKEYFEFYCRTKLRKKYVGSSSGASVGLLCLLGGLSGFILVRSIGSGTKGVFCNPTFAKFSLESTTPQ